MRYMVGFLLIGLLNLPQNGAAQASEEAAPKVAVAILRQHGLPPQWTLRAIYYLYLDADGDNGATFDQTEPRAGEPKSEQADGETSESNLEEPASYSAPRTEVLDIDTLSQRAIEHYEIQSEQKKKFERRRRRGRTIGIPIAVATVVSIAVMLAVGSSWANSSD